MGRCLTPGPPRPQFQPVKRAYDVPPLPWWYWPMMAGFVAWILYLALYPPLD